MSIKQKLVCLIRLQLLNINVFALANFAVCIISLIFIIGCSNNKSSQSIPSTGDASSLIIQAPNIVASLPTSAINYAYILITNPTNFNITGLTYRISQTKGSGNLITISENSVNNCSTIVAQSTCTIELIVPAKLVAGSFLFSITNGISNSLENPTIGVQPIFFTTSISELNPIYLFFYSTVIADTPNITITGIVNSTPSPTQSFNMVTLLDTNGNPLPNQQVISGNLGAQVESLVQGNTFEIVIPVPAGSNSVQSFTVQTSLESADGNSTNINNLSTTYSFNTLSNIGIVVPLPQQINLTESNPEQIITLHNIGNQIAQINNLSVNNTNLSFTIDGSTIAPNASKPLTVKLIDKNVPANTSNLTYSISSNYNNYSENITIYQDINPLGPIPLPPLPVAVYPGLAVYFSPDNQFYTNSYTGQVSRVVTINNTGNSTESNFSFTLPNNFSISSIPSGIPNPAYCQISGTTITSKLKAGNDNSSCSFIMTYTNQKVTPQSFRDISIDYDYGDNRISYDNEVGVTYGVSQATANLSFIPQQHDFGSIIGNNYESSSIFYFNLYNSGTSSATNIQPSIYAQNQTTAFKIESNTCIGAVNPGNSCLIGVNFGPIAVTSNTIFSQTLISYYLPYPSQLFLPAKTTTKLVGRAVTPKTATFTMVMTSASEFSGKGTESKPFSIFTTVQGSPNTFSGTNGKITLTITNTSDEAARGMFFNLNIATLFWQMVSASTCGISSDNRIDLNPGVSCTIVIRDIGPIVGINNFYMGWLIANWRDQAHPQGTSSSISTDIIYVNNLIAPPVTLITPTSTNSPTLPTITIKFPVVVSNINNSTITLTNTANENIAISAISSLGNNTYQFTPKNPLFFASTYYINLKDTIKVAAGGTFPASTLSFSTLAVQWQPLNNNPFSQITVGYTNESGDLYVGGTTLNNTPATLYAFKLNGARTPASNNASWNSLITIGQGTQRIQTINGASTTSNLYLGLIINNLVNGEGFMVTFNPTSGALNSITNPGFNYPIGLTAAAYSSQLNQIFFSDGQNKFYGGPASNNCSTPVASDDTYVCQQFTNFSTSNTIGLLSNNTANILWIGYSNNIYSCPNFNLNNCSAAASQFQGVSALAIDNNGSVYVMSSNYGLVQLNYLNLFFICPNSVCNLPSGTTPIAYDNYHNNIVVYNNSNRNFQLFNVVNSTFVSVNPTFPALPNGENPISILFDNNHGIVYAVTSSGIFWLQYGNY